MNRMARGMEVNTAKYAAGVSVTAPARCGHGVCMGISLVTSVGLRMRVLRFTFRLLHYLGKGSWHLSIAGCVDATAGPTVVTNRTPGPSALNQSNCRNCGNVSHDSRCVCRDSNRPPSEYEPGASPLHQTVRCQAIIPQGKPAQSAMYNLHANECESKFSYLCK
jgi:hypothetical protein